MYQGEHGESVTERFMNHMPGMENLLRAGQEEKALGKGGFFRSGMDRLFEFAMLCGDESEKRREVFASAQGMATKACHTEQADDVEDHHVDQSDRNGQARDLLGVGHPQQRPQVGLGKKPLRGQLLGKVLLQFLQLLHRELYGGDSAGNLGVEIPSDNAAGRDRKHDPESHAGDTFELQGGVESDNKRRSQAHQYMDV